MLLLSASWSNSARTGIGMTAIPRPSSAKRRSQRSHGRLKWIAPCPKLLMTEIPRTVVRCATVPMAWRPPREGVNV